MYLDSVKYLYGDRLFLDNVGGYGGYTGYTGLHIKNSHRIYLSNFTLFGEKGNYGGQEQGLYLNNVGKSHFSNFQIDGFKKSAIFIDGADEVIFSNFDILNSDRYGFEFVTTTDIHDITISNFKISAAQKGIAFWAQNEKAIQKIIISNGSIVDIPTGTGITLGDDGSSGAICSRVKVNNVIFDNLSGGIDEGFHSDYNQFSNLIFRNVTTPIVNKVGEHTWIYKCIGYDTENFKVANKSVTIGLNGSYGPPTVITSRSGRISYPRVKITWGGTFQSTETVTVKVEAVYTNGSTAYTECPATATGSFWLTDDNINQLITDGKDIVKLNIYAKTNKASTSVTVTIDSYGKG
jgi:hypothetical protein